MPNFKIFAESKADIKFITDYTLEHFGVALSNADFYSLNSWSGYKAGGGVIEAIQQNFDNGAETILILDADNDFNARQSEVLTDFETYGIPIHLFLSPNNLNVGCLETILCEIAIERTIITCFEGYEACIEGYQVPVIKSKVFAYLDALLPEQNKKNDKNDLIQDGKRNYRNPAHWNLQHEYLQPLKDFLSPFFIQE